MKIMLFLFILATYQCLAQDIIYKMDGSVLKCKIVEIGDKNVKYRKLNNPTGPLYVTSKFKVLLIEFENKTYEFPNFDLDQKEILEPEIVTNEPIFIEDTIPLFPFEQNFISLNFPALIFGQLNFSFEHIANSGKYGIRMPVKIGFETENYENAVFYSKQLQKPIFSVELDLFFYAQGQNSVSYVNGIGIEWGLANYFTIDTNEFGNEIKDISANNYVALFFYNGFSVHIAKNIGISMLVGLGNGKNLDVNSNIEIKANFSFNVGYRF